MSRLQTLGARLRASLMTPVLLGGLALAAASLPAHAGLFDDEEARKAILDLRSQIDRNTLAQQNFQNRQTQLNDQHTEQLANQQAAIDQLKRSLLELNNQIELLRSEIAKMRGQDEQSGFQVKEVARDVAEAQRKLKDQLAGLDERLRKLEPQKVTVDGREVTVDPDEKRAFDAAMATLRQGDFNQAAGALQAFQKRYPSSPYHGQVLYWLGQSLYGKGDVKEALAAFRELVTTYPQHPQAPEAMLAMANCQIELKDNRAARKTVDELVKAFPQSEAARAGRERVAKLKP
ncbi:MAG: hypothetical protein RJA44_2495 [Pseudomonadota bacterium]|jgi:tol-pal system protein YbgF